MTHRPEEELAEYALGLLPEAQRRELDAALSASPALRRELDVVREALGLVAAGAGPALHAPAQGRARLLAALDGGKRFRPFLRDLARHFDLSLARMRELFQQIDDAKYWEAGPLPGIAVMHFAGGP